jgi:predicted SprT family Zn-dependent metalloprotease
MKVKCKCLTDLNRFEQEEQEEKKKMLSRDCDGCAQLHICSKRYRNVTRGEKVYCQDGTAHLVDEGTQFQAVDLYEKHIEAFN